MVLAVILIQSIIHMSFLKNHLPGFYLHCLYPVSLLCKKSNKNENIEPPGAVEIKDSSNRTKPELPLGDIMGT